MALKFNPLTGQFDEYGPILTGTGTVSAAADGTAALPGIAFANDLNTGIYRPGDDQVAISTNGTGRLFVDASGNVGIGTTAVDTTLHIQGANTSGRGQLYIQSTATNVYPRFILADSADTMYLDVYADTSNQEVVRNVGSGGKHVWQVGGGNEKARIDSSGRLLVGTSTSAGAGEKIQIAGTDYAASAISLTRTSIGAAGASLNLVHTRSATYGTFAVLSNDDNLGSIYFRGDDGTDYDTVGASIQAYVDGTPGADDMPGRLVFSTTADGASSPTERMRIHGGGTITIGKSSLSTTVSGIVLWPDGLAGFTRSAEAPGTFNRLTNDGVIINLLGQSVIEGTISVSGTTVSYNGAHLSRWSQLVGIDPYDKNARPEILRGTVMSNLDEMCDWTCPTSGDCQDNEQLNKTEISSVDDDPNVAGVFQSWDDDDDTWVNDFYLAMTGDFVIRIAAGTTVQRGDLLCSAGDGTARPQGDRYLKDSTIAKVTSTTVSCTHPDGSYCVPCVLMAC